MAVMFAIGVQTVLLMSKRPLSCSQCERCCFGSFMGWFVDSLRNPLTMLRLFTGVVLEVSVFVFEGVDVRATELFSFRIRILCILWTGDFLAIGATSFIISSGFLLLCLTDQTLYLFSKMFYLFQVSMLYSRRFTRTHNKVFRLIILSYRSFKPQKLTQPLPSFSDF